LHSVHGAPPSGTLGIPHSLPIARRFSSWIERNGLATIRSIQELEEAAMYKVMGTDGKEYGPVSAEVLREWIAQRRANGQTRVQADGSVEGKSLSELPEFTAALASAPR